MVGKLVMFRASKSGGFGLLRTASGELYFVHRNDVIRGLPVVGAEAEFAPAPKSPGGRHPRAVDVAFGAGEP